ncbi:MAG: TetR/AcrR family transcriptional regulator [Actinomycetota bacterium]|jgi:AcrR family transcriptional regulator
MKQDRRSKRTRAWLLETLLELLENKEYSGITVTELTEKADIARQTFYRNYDSMDDILVSRLNEIIDEYLEKVFRNLETKKDPDWDFEVKQLIFLWQRNEVIFRALKKAGLDYQVMEKLSHLFTRFHMKAQNLRELDDKQQFLVYYLAGGVFMVLNKWFENDMKFPTDQLTDLFRRAADNVDQIAREYTGR